MPLHYRLRIRNATDTADDLVVTSIPEGVNPYIAEDGIPEGDGQTLNPVTGEVVAGTMTVGVVDVITDFSVDELVASDGFEYVDQAAMEAAGYVFVDTFTGGALAVGATDQVYAGTRSLKAAISGGDGELKSTKTWTAADGIQPLRQYVVFARVRAKNRDWFDVGAKLYVTGSTGPTEAAVTVANEFQLLRVVATSTVDAELTTQLYRNGGFGSAEDTWFDALEIWTHTTGEGRIVTSRLADAQGRQQLLSRRAFLEETPDGVTFPVLVAGYVTMCELTTAMRYTIGVGESRRVEASVRVFEVAEPGFDRVSCILGGPVIGDFGPIPDLGRPRFQVVDTGEAGIVVLQWTGGELYQPLGEATPGIDASEDSNNLGYFNALANQYLGEFDGGVGQPFPDLVVRLMDIETGPGVTSNPPTGANGFPVLTADEADFTPVSSYSGGLSLPGALAYDLIGETDRIRIRWPVGLTEPDNGDRCKLVVFPRTISERNPLHWRGHPMDLATGLMTLRGQPFDATSAAAVRTELGDTLLIELRITAGMTLKEALETFVYGPFGVAPRVNDAGEYEFITTRHRPSDPPVTTITLDDLVSYDPTAWRIEESSAVNKVTFKTKAFTPISGPPRTEGLNRDPGNPIDYIRATDVPVEATPNPSDFEIYGERSVTYALPGRLLNVERFSFVAAVAAELFEERGRGAIVSQLAVRRDGPDPRLGEETILNLPHLPTANPTQSPVSQRGTTPRIAVVIRRTPTPAGPLLTVVDRGIALQASLIPEFTLVPSTGEPRKIATLAITNGVALAAAGVTVRIEWAVSSGTPITGQLLRTLDPATDALTFDLPAVDAGARVWARLRTEKVGTRPGTWSAFDDADLTDLDAPTAFTGQLSGGFIDLTWTLGANATDIPIEILLREDAVAGFDSVVILPIGSTQYRLQLPTSETDYVIGVRHREAAPFAGVSPTTTLAVTSEAAVGLTAPINPAVFADGRGTFGLEVTATVLPSGTEFWVATETAPGSGVHDTSAAVQLVESVADGRTRFTNPSIAANDGKLRYLKARHVVGEATSDFCAELGIEPWLLLPPVDPDPDPEPPVGLTRLPVDLSFDCPINVLEIPLARTPITPWRSAELQYPFTDHRLIRFEATVLRAGTVGSYLAGEIEPTGAPGIYAPMAEDGVGPLLPLDEASLDLLDPAGALLVPKQWVVVSESVPIRDEAKADLRARVVIGGGDDATGDVLLGRLAFQVVAGPTEAVEPPEVHDPPPDDPGSCTTPSTLDVTDFDSELEPSGATWSIDGTDAVLTLDGTGSGEASQTTDFTGLEPDQEYTFYLTVNPDAAVEAFLEVVGGDRAVSTGTGSQTLVARGVTDGSGNLSVTRGVTAIEDAPASAGSDPLSHADQAAAEAAGWVFTNTNTGGSFEFASGVDVGPFGTSMALRAKNNGVGLLRMERTFSVVNGQNYRGRVWADASETEPWWSAMELRLTSGANVFADSINGGVAEKHLDVTIVASGTSLTARIEIEPVDFYGGVKPWRIAGFTLDGVAGGGATVRFSDLGSCVGSGLGDGGTGVGDGDGEGGPGTDPVPDPGTDPTPAAPGDRPYGTFNINVGIVNVWNLVPKHFTVGNAINLINAARTAGSKLCFFSYGEPDWRDAAGVFRYLLWKAKWDLLIGNATVKAAIDAAIADGVIVFHYVIDEPYNRNVLPYGGPVAFVDAEKMCLDSKAAFPTLPTMIALAPRAAQQGWWMTRHMSGLDWLYHDWKPAHGDVTLFRDQNIDRAREIGHIFAPGIHYERFVGDRYIMPAELRHYGKILTDPRTGETENFAPFWLGWKFNAMMYATPDFQPADRSVRDNFRSNYP